MSAGPSVVEVVGLRKEFRGSGRWSLRKGKMTALEGVGFRLGPGEFAALVGESGSGKTTLGRCVMGLLPFDAGEICVAGFDVGHLRQRDRKAFTRRAQMVFQNPYASLNPAFRVRSILAEAVRIHRGLPKKAVGEEVEKLARLVRLPLERLGEFPPNLSGGERRRVAFAQALATRPIFTVTDEPVSGLDSPIQVQLLDIFRRVHAQREITFLLISHDLRVVRILATRVMVLYRGQIVEDAPAERFFSGGACHPYSWELLTSAFDTERYLRGESARQPGPAAECGCLYRHRCQRAEVDEKGPCATMTPPAVNLAPNHWVACHMWAKC